MADITLWGRKRALGFLARKLSVLKVQERQRYIYRLDDFASDWAKGIEGGRQPELGSLITCKIYESLYMKSKTSPEFPSMKTKEDRKADRRFHELFAGVQSYALATDEERETFKKSALGLPNVFEKALYEMRVLKSIL